jgi:hypothetical protein
MWKTELAGAGIEVCARNGLALSPLGDGPAPEADCNRVGA